MPQPNLEYIEDFWSLFRYVEWEPEDMVELRKIAHDGTWQQSEAIQPALSSNVPQIIHGKCKYAAGSVGYYMCPGVLNDRRANDKSVSSLVCICIDIDKGDTSKILGQLKYLFGQPTLCVHSGGYTETNHPKMHVYYRLSEPESNTKEVAIVREALAKKVGADVSFKRIPQVIRVPGSIYDKNMEGIVVSVLEKNLDNDVEFSDITEILQDDIDYIKNNVPSHLDFSYDPERQSKRLHEIAGTKIHAGGSDDTRYDRFTEYTGRWIAHARSGDCTIEEAFGYVQNWNEENMVPPWEPERVHREFNAILQVDMQNHAKEWQAAETDDPTKTRQDWSWFDYDARSLFSGKPEPVPFLIDEMVVEGSNHSLVADGGVGKTYVALEMALRLAVGPKKGNNLFGFPITRECVSIVFTVEDGRDDIHRRIYNIDISKDLLPATEGRFFVMPVADEIVGGLPLVEKDRQGNHESSNAWKALTEKMQEIRDAFPTQPFVVFFDTYSAMHHGDENSSVGTNEWFRSANLVKTKFNAAMLVTHHIRKTNNEPVNSPDEMRNHIRGSNAFMNSCRINLGLWHFPGSRNLAAEIAADPAEQAKMQFINFAPIKNNIGLDWSHRTSPEHPEPIVTLRRTGSGRLVFDADAHEKRVTYKKRQKQQNAENQKRVEMQCRSAILLSITEFAKKGRPLNLTEILKEGRVTLPYPVSDMPKKKLEETVQSLISEGKIVRKNIRANGTRMNIHDVPDGRYGSEEETERASDSVRLDWSEWEYSDEEEDYIKKEET